MVSQHNKTYLIGDPKPVKATGELLRKIFSGVSIGKPAHENSDLNCDAIQDTYLTKSKTTCMGCLPSTQCAVTPNTEYMLGVVQPSTQICILSRPYMCAYISVVQRTVALLRTLR